MKSIILIGMMGSGKTTIGKTLATDLNYSWIDTDQYIQKVQNKSIPDLFNEQGEQYFRECETKALEDLISKVNIISTGGGIIVTERNREILTQSNAFVIYLRTSINTLQARIDPTNRPLLHHENLISKLQILYQNRYQWYESCADLIIDTDQYSVVELVNLIKESINKK